MDFLARIVARCAREAQAVRDAPLALLFSAVLGAVSVYVGLHIFYQQQDQAIRYLRVELAPVAGEIPEAGRRRIEPTSPQYLSAMSNDELRRAAYVLSAKLDAYLGTVYQRISTIRTNETAPLETRAALTMDLGATIDREFRDRFALDTVNLLVELGRRTRSLSQDIDEINSGRIDAGEIDNFATHLDRLAKLLR